MICSPDGLMRYNNGNFAIVDDIPLLSQWIKKLRTSIEVLNFLEASPRFELGNKGFADLCLTTWL